MLFSTTDPEPQPTAGNAKIRKGQGYANKFANAGISITGKRDAAFLANPGKSITGLCLALYDFLQIGGRKQAGAERLPQRGDGILGQLADNFIVFKCLQRFLIHKYLQLACIKYTIKFFIYYLFLA